MTNCLQASEAARLARTVEEAESVRTATILILLLSLGACADGRWVVRDLSSVSFKFAAPGPAGPFAKPSTATRPLPPSVSHRRAALQDLAVVGR